LKRINNHKKYINLREDFLFFEYQSYNFSWTDDKLLIEFVFNLSDKYIFKPKLEVEIRPFFKEGSLKQSDIQTLVFNIGMVEMLSYWKIACPPKIIIRPHTINNEQNEWWKKLYFNGLGEFFYLNTIEASLDNFVEIFSEGKVTKPVETKPDYQKTIVPIGGGKDSVVSLELLKAGGMDIFPMMVNPSPAGQRTIENAGYSLNESLVVRRYLDPLMLQLNKEDYLNGHTPFSALLAFVNVLVAAIAGIGNIALSNENSANESTVPGTDINHQYSKSFEFEQDFDFYCRKYIHKGVNYFSFLRPLNEMQIARLFSGFPQHFPTFRSCNVGSKNDEWCGNCPKCLFTFVILSPFVGKAQLLNIFGGDLLSRQNLKPVLLELSGKAEIKPFECVGTVGEVNASLAWIKDNEKGGAAKNGLLGGSEFNNLTHSGLDNILSEFNEENNLPAVFLKIIKEALHD
jgi:hypothetical protein